MKSTLSPKHVEIRPSRNLTTQKFNLAKNNAIPSARVDARANNTILMNIFNVIGAVTNPTEASMVLISWNFLSAVCKNVLFVHRLHPHPVLDHCARHCQKKLDDETAYFDFDVEVLWLRPELSNRVI